MMDRATQKRVFAEIRGYFENSGTKLSDRETYHRASTYTDPTHHQRERELLRRYPLIVGRSASISKSGDFLTDDSTGVPIIVSRQANGSVKALINVCRHRAARVCVETSGHRTSFVCPYHAWSYKTDGSLRAVPSAAFPGLDLASHGLIELPAEERHGFIWVVATPGARIDVAAHLGDLDTELATYDIENFVVEREVVRQEAINWKFVIDGFLEVYHFPTLHANSIAPYFHGKYSPFDAFGRNGRLVGVRASFAKVIDLPFDEVDLMPHIAVNYQIFPNTVLVWQGDHFEVWISSPGQAPNNTSVRVQSLTTVDMSGKTFAARWDRNWKVLIDTVVTEDWAISMAVQNSLPFVADDRIVFGRNEPGLQHFHKQLEDAVAAP
jgi:nitrite reductase/ring-hydroxylating ferredoxin subunit